MARADRFTDSDIKSQLYSDFLTNMNIHPISGDVVRFINEHAVIRSIRNLLSTNKGERYYQPDIGSNIRHMLFEQMGDATSEEIVALIRETITKHESRAKIININVSADPENHKYNITLTVLILNQQDPVTFSVSLNRIR